MGLIVGIGGELASAAFPRMRATRLEAVHSSGMLTDVYRDGNLRERVVLHVRFQGLGIWP